MPVNIDQIEREAIGLSLMPGQKSLIKHYNDIDPEAQLLGFHYRGVNQYQPRPVVYTYTLAFPDPTISKRHVVVIQRNGEPGDLPENWEDGFGYLEEGVPQPSTVRFIIQDWLSWAVRA